MRIGIATGLAVTGDLVGVGAVQTVTAVGETPNLAARLQALAQPDTVVVSETTRVQLGQLFELEDLGLQALKGFDKPIRAWRVRGKTKAASRSETIYTGRPRRLVGRDEELSLLLHWWQACKAGSGQVVLLSGEAGIGKSRLLATLEERLATDPHVSLCNFCSQHHQNSPLYPLIARLERDAGFIRGDTPADRLSKLEAFLAPTEPPPADVALLGALLSIPANDRYPLPELTPQQCKARTTAALLRRLSGLGRRGPVLMLVEDAHWADPSTVELLDAVIDQVPNLPVLLVISFRPEFVAPWLARPGVSLMALNRLDQRDARMLAVQIVESRLPSATVLDRVVTRSDGVPLFIEELTRAVLEAPQRDTPFAVPDTLQASLMARLDRLPTAKAVAQIGSVIGREFPHTLIQAVAGPHDAQLPEALDQLIKAGLLFRHGAPPDAVYTFKHALVRDVVYASLVKAPRQHLHHSIGEALRDHLPERADIEPEVVAYHFAQAGSKQAAVEWWSKAGRQALQRSALREAMAHLRNAMELSETLDDTPEQRLVRLGLQLMYCNAVRAVHGFSAPETKAAFARAYEIAETVGNAPERFAALYGLWNVKFIEGDMIATRRLAHEYLRGIEGQPGSPHARIAYRICGMTSFLAGEFLDARWNLERAVALHETGPELPPAYRYNMDLAMPPLLYFDSTLQILGVQDGPGSLVEKAITYAVQTKHNPTIASIHVNSLAIAMMWRDRARSRLYAGVLRDLARERGLTAFLPYCDYCEGWLRCQAGDQEAGLVQMRGVLQKWHEQGAPHARPIVGVLLSGAEAAAGHHDAALATIDAELANMTETGLYYFLADAHRVRGEILIRTGPAAFEAAEAAFATAIDIARRQSARRFELHAARCLARLWTDQGKSGEDHELLTILRDGIAAGSGANTHVDTKDAVGGTGRLSGMT
ncbi:MAG: AAA family ATPase [Rhodopila sp.]